MAHFLLKKGKQTIYAIIYLFILKLKIKIENKRNSAEVGQIFKNT